MDNVVQGIDLVGKVTLTVNASGSTWLMSHSVTTPQDVLLTWATYKDTKKLIGEIYLYTLEYLDRVTSAYTSITLYKYMQYIQQDIWVL